MPLPRGEYQGHDFDHRVCKFTMKNGETVIPCKIGWAAMDDIERRQDVQAHQREEQFNRIRDHIESIATSKFFSFTDDDRPNEILITSHDLNG